MQSTFNFNNNNNSTASSNRFNNVNILANQSNINPSNTQTYGNSNITGTINSQPSFMSQNQTQQSNFQPQLSQVQQPGAIIPQLPSQQYISNLNSSSTMNTAMNNLNEPSWYNNPKKRVIPQNLVKRSTLRNGLKNNHNNSNSINDSSNDLNNDLDNSFYHVSGSLKNKNDLLNNSLGNNHNQNDKSGFNNITFGSKKNLIDFKSGSSINGLGKENDNIFNSSQLNNDNLLMDSNDAPPLISLNDWKREDEFGSLSNSNLIGTNINNSIKNSAANLININSINSSNSGLTSNNITGNLNKSQLINDVKRSSANVFDKNDSLNINSNSVLNKNNKSDNDKQNELSQNNEFAIIVFGYPESVSNNIITHFSHFGNILENFEVLRRATGINKFTINTSSSTNKNNNKNLDIEFKYPIYTGEGWVKLTYNSQASALRALKENGTIFAGSLLGCVPYSKNIIEQLASCKINKNENIGENTLNITNLSAATMSNTTNSNEISGTNSVNQTNDANINGSSLSKVTTSNELKTKFSNNAFGSVSNERDLKTIISNPTSESNNKSNNDLQNNLNINKNNSGNLPFIQRLNVKDGKSLFIHNSNADNHNFVLNLENKMRKHEEVSRTNNKENHNNGGVFNSVNNWLFGWNNL